MGSGKEIQNCQRGNEFAQNCPSLPPSFLRMEFEVVLFKKGTKTCASIVNRRNLLHWGEKEGGRRKRKVKEERKRERERGGERRRRWRWLCFRPSPSVCFYCRRRGGERRRRGAQYPEPGVEKGQLKSKSEEEEEETEGNIISEALRH